MKNLLEHENVINLESIDLYVLVVNMTIKIKTDLQHSHLVSKCFRVTLFRHQWLVADWVLTDWSSSTYLDIGDVQTHGVASKESQIFESSQPPSLFREGQKIYDSLLATPCVRSHPNVQK